MQPANLQLIPMFTSRKNNKVILIHLGICLSLLFLCNSCILHDLAVQNALNKRGIQMSLPLREPLTDFSPDDQFWKQIQSLKATKEDAHPQFNTRFRATPKIHPLIETTIPKKRRSAGGKMKRITVNLDALPLPAFINDVYGNILKMPFEIASNLRNRKDLVTLRAEKPMSTTELDGLVRQVLGNYGVAIERQGDLLRFSLGRGTSVGEPPLLVSGRTLPEVPISHRPVFQLVPLNVVRNVHVAGWLKQAYKGQKLDVLEDPERNAVLLMGTPSIVAQALKAVRLLDQPYMRGRHSIRIEPMFLDADELARGLVSVLNAEGYAATLKPPMGSIIILPVKRVSAVLVFAADAGVLEHVREWAANLDRPSQKDEEKIGLFYYQMRNSQAKSLADVLDKLLSGVPKEGGKDEKSRKAKSYNLVVDEVRNGILFQGDFGKWEEMLSVIRELDRPARMVLIEVTVAEVTLNDQENIGIEWAFKNIGINATKMALGTWDGLGVGAKGLSYILDNAGQTRAFLNAFENSSRVSILSTPRIMVKSGGQATIDVGTEIPVITSRGTSSDVQVDGSSGILQEIQYRKTGTLLSVNPVVHSDNRIDLEISQEVSKSGSDSSLSPSIFTRRISTSLSLKDGGSVLLGGLISSNTNRSHQGVPGLSNIPILGHLFRSDNESETRTEMMMLIVPYIIENNQDAEAITESFQNRLRHISPGTGDYISDQKALDRTAMEPDEKLRPDRPLPDALHQGKDLSNMATEPETEFPPDRKYLPGMVIEPENKPESDQTQPEPVQVDNQVAPEQKRVKLVSLKTDQELPHKPDKSPPDSDSPSGRNLLPLIIK